jgi:hypothetical protein
MRIREFQDELKKAKTNLDDSFIYSGNNMQIRDNRKFIDSLLFLDSNAIARDYVQQLKDLGYLDFSDRVLNLTNSAASQVMGLINQIKYQVGIVQDTIRDSFHFIELDDNTISIKIESLKKFSDLKDIADKLKKTIELPVGEFEEGGEIEIINFDSGSFWFDILLPTSASVVLVGSIAWAGAVIYKKYQEAFAFKSYAKGLVIQEEHLEALKDAAAKKISLDIETEAKLIQSEFYNSSDNEQLERLKLSIKEYSELIQKGVQIQPAITAPENISNLFPNYKTLDLIESKQKYLPPSEE